MMWARMEKAPIPLVRTLTSSRVDLSARLLLDVGDTESRRVDPVADVGVGRELEHGQVLDVNVDTDVAWGSGPDVFNWPDYGSE